MELKMKRLMIFTGATMALGGSLGLINYRTATVDAFNVFINFDPPLPALQVSLLAETAFVIGVVSTFLAMLMQDRSNEASNSIRWLRAASGSLLVVGAGFLIWSLLDVKEEFRVVGSAVTAPTVETLQNMIHGSELRITTGYSLWLLSAIALSLGFSADPQDKPASETCWRTTSNIAMMMFVVFSGVLLLSLLLLISRDGKSLEMMTTGKVLAKPEHIARHLSGILNKSILVSGGVAMLGAVQIWASLWKTTPDSTAASSS